MHKLKIAHWIAGQWTHLETITEIKKQNIAPFQGELFPTSVDDFYLDFCLVPQIIFAYLYLDFIKMESYGICVYIILFNMFGKLIHMIALSCNSFSWLYGTLVSEYTIVYLSVYCFCTFGFLLIIGYEECCNIIFLFSFFFFLFRATPAAHRKFPGWIRAVAAGLRHSHSNKGSKLCLHPMPHLVATLDP